jgi:hypothetical protein
MMSWARSYSYLILIFLYQLYLALLKINNGIEKEPKGAGFS